MNQDNAGHCFVTGVNMEKLLVGTGNRLAKCSWLGDRNLCNNLCFSSRGALWRKQAGIAENPNPKKIPTLTKAEFNPQQAAEGTVPVPARPRGVAVGPEVQP